MSRTIPHTDFSVFPIVLGTALFGSAIPKKEAFELLDAYAEAGGNFLDTAHIYAAWLPGGEGMSERTVGRWIRLRQARKGIILATKGAHSELATGESHMNRAALNRHLAESLERLQVDHVDLYWLHRDDPAVPAGEILDWLEELLSQGLVRAVGCSNWTWRRIEEARSYAQRLGRRGFCASQIGWSLAAVDPAGPGPAGMLFMDPETLAYHERTRFPVLAYSAQASGFFSGRYRRDMKPEDRKPNVRPWVLERYGSRANFERLARVEEMAASMGVSANQVALAWLLSRPLPVFPVIGPGTYAQLKDSLGALSVTLTQEQSDFLWHG
ncbi:aldo/keto reductase [Verrucomicrobiota bacterium]